MRVIYRKISHARYLYIKRNVEQVWGARYLSKNTVFISEQIITEHDSNFQSPVVAIGTTRFNAKNFTFCPRVGQQNISTDGMFKFQIIQFNPYRTNVENRVSS